VKNLEARELTRKPNVEFGPARRFPSCESVNCEWSFAMPRHALRVLLLAPCALLAVGAAAAFAPAGHAPAAAVRSLAAAAPASSASADGPDAITPCPACW
jgi:hypothetical protein